MEESWISGSKEWAEIIDATKNFIDSPGQHNYKDASEFMLKIDSKGLDIEG